MAGWIKLHKSLSDWEWYSDHNATRLLIHLLISVNYEDKKWRGTTIKSGSMVLSWSSLSVKSGLSLRQCRTAMDKLISSGEVTKQLTSKYQVISLAKWGKLQEKEKHDDKIDDRQMTDRWQADDRQMTTTKEVKENKEIKEFKEIDIIERKRKFYNLLTPYISDLGKNLIQDFFEYWTEHGPNDKKFRMEKEKSFALERRLKTWKSNENKFKPQNFERPKTINRQTEEVIRQNSELVDSSFVDRIRNLNGH
jgi:hypothetical protein